MVRGMSKLTLSIDDDVIRRAKRYAAKRATSLSQLVEQYPTSFRADPKKPGSRTRPFFGCCEGQPVASRSKTTDGTSSKSTGEAGPPRPERRSRCRPRTPAPRGAAARLWAALETGRGKGYIPAHGMTTVYYVIEKTKGAAFARQAIGALLTAFGVAPFNETVLRRAIALGWLDLEDGVCTAAGRREAATSS